MTSEDNPDPPPTPPMCQDTQQPDEIMSSVGADDRSDTADVGSIPLDEHDINWTPHFRYGAGYHDQVDTNMSCFPSVAVSIVAVGDEAVERLDPKSS
jgi:hypothetical protein